MSKQAGLLTLTDLNAADAPCCPPIAQRRMPAETAVVLAPAFKALGDPVDPYDVGAEVGEPHGGERRRPQPGQLDHAQPGQRAGRRGGGQRSTP